MERQGLPAWLERVVERKGRRVVVGPHITVHSLDAGACLAVIHADAHISGTDDPLLILTIRDALRDPVRQHHPASTAFAAAALDAISRRGLRGVAVGYRSQRDPGPDSPVATYLSPLQVE